MSLSEKETADQRKCQAIYDEDPAVKEMFRRLINAGISVDTKSELMGTRVRQTTRYQHRWDPHSILALYSFFARRIQSSSTGFGRTDLSADGFTAFLKQSTSASFQEVVDKRKEMSSDFGLLVGFTIFVPFIIITVSISNGRSAGWP